MTERAFGQSRDIPIAEFSYRHEAEFAAGFLSDAGIPFRLQVDDAGGADAGVTIARPAILWVRQEDVARARELLDIDSDPPAQPLREGREPRVGRRDALVAPLSKVERGVAVGFSVLFLFLAIRAGEGGLTVVAYTCLGLAALLGGSALLGLTLTPIRAALRALSGGAP